MSETVGREHRQPWHLLLSKSKKQEIIIPLKPEVQLISFEPDEYDRHYYVFQQIDSDLLIAIDQNDVSAVEAALKKDKIDVNNQYMIPFWEVPDAGGPQLQTFLHRALWEKSADVFNLLLEKGADPRIEGHCGETVVSALFGRRYPVTDKEIDRFGKMLVDAGVAVEEIERVFFRDKECQRVARDVIAYARLKARPVCRHKAKKSKINNDHVRE